MKKIYQEPDVEFISLVPQDEITSGILDGTVRTESNTLFG
jgi:hypothetical protein